MDNLLCAARCAAMALVLALNAVACRDVSGPNASVRAFVHIGAELQLGFRAADASFVNEIAVDVSGLINPIVIAPACSPNGAHATYLRVPQTGSGYGFFFVNSDGSGLRQLVVAGATIGPGAWSPAGDRLAVKYTKPGDAAGMAIINADAAVLVSLPVTLAPNEVLSWAPDGSEILYTQGGALERVMAVSVSTGATRQIAASGRRARWSPDGQRIAFLGSFGPPNISVVNKDGTSSKVLVTAGGQIVPRSFTWHPDGRILFETDGKLYFVDMNGSITPFIPEGIQRDPHWCGTP